MRKIWINTDDLLGASLMLTSLCPLGLSATYNYEATHAEISEQTQEKNIELCTVNSKTDHSCVIEKNNEALDKKIKDAEAARIRALILCGAFALSGAALSLNGSARFRRGDYEPLKL